MVFLSCNAFAAKTQKALILYDLSTDKREPSLNDARYLSNLLGHFNTVVNILPINSYQTGDMGKNDIVFYINYEKKYNLPQNFLSDFYANNKKFCWLNHQIGQLDQSFLKNKYGFHFVEYREDLQFNKVIYKNMIFPKGDDNLSIVNIDNPSLAIVPVYAINTKGDKAPYILNSKNFWFVADSPFSYFIEQDRYIVFADLLHDIIGENHPESHTGLVKIEDVNPATNYREVLRMARYLRSQKVPFSIGVVPVYIDPENKLEYHLEDNPRLLSLLKKIQSYGGVIVQHGYTHQYHGVTTDDYEFWDDVADKPVRGDSVENTSLRIEKGLKELINNDIYPFAWETPHYFASKNAYLAIKKHFSVVYERRGVMQYLGSDQYFPYTIKDMYGQFVIPENLGYLHLDKPDPDYIIQAAKLNLSVRDGYASFFFHPFVEIKYLKKIIVELKNMGYQFKDIRSYTPNVHARDKAILTEDSKVRVDSQDKYISVKEYDYSGNEKMSKIITNTPGKPVVSDISVLSGRYAVVKPQDSLEPGFFMKIWKLAKADITYMKGKTIKKSYSKLADILDVIVINPDSPARSREAANDLNAMKSSLTTAGVVYKEITAKDIKTIDLRDYDIIVIPYAAAENLDGEERAKIKEAVSSGSNVVFDGNSKLAEDFNIQLQEAPIKIKQIRDYQFPEMPLYWTTPITVRPVYKSSDSDYRVLCVEDESNSPIVVSGKLDKGSFIYFSTLFDPNTDKGYSQYPFFIEMLDTVFSCSPIAHRRTVEMYFDPGMRQNISIEKLAKLWRKNGVNKIYAAGWHFYDKYTYEYERMIKVCHQNGILVYCWLEPPMVNQKFWNKHPQWREKTAQLKDAKVSWRFLMNFADPECRKKAFSEIEALLYRYDWDGVNLAEFYFESSSGPEQPQSFTPMNPEVRSEFKKAQGFDPVDLFNPENRHYWKTNPEDWQKFTAYRMSLCNRLKSNFLVMLSDVKKKKTDFEIMMTVIDTTLMPSLSEKIAEDMDELFRMQKKFDITVQIEDASFFWSGKPERYSQLGEHYRKFVKDKSELVLDCNILDNHKKGLGDIPCEKPTGEEMRHITYNMDVANCRPAFYSEETINETDYKNITSVLARNAKISKINDSEWKITTPSMVSLKTGKKNLITQLDGEFWFAVDGDNVIVPAGEHVLSFESESRYFDMSKLKPRLSYISGELKWASFLNNAIEFSYSSDNVPCWIEINKNPNKIYIDEKKYSFTALKGDNGYTLKLPAGTHAAKISVGGGLIDLIESSGVILLSIIIIFGFFTSVLFLGLFIIIQIKRKILK
jgi:uncharacterized protein YdaL